MAARDLNDCLGNRFTRRGWNLASAFCGKKRKEQDYNVVLDSRWVPGLWLGRKWGSITHLVATPAGVVEVRAVQSRPAPERWDKEELSQLRATPWCPQPTVEGARRGIPGAAGPGEPPAVRMPADYQPKRVYIRPEDLEKWGVYGKLPTLHSNALRPYRPRRGAHRAVPNAPGGGHACVWRYKSSQGGREGKHRDRPPI